MITSLSPKQANAERLLALNRGHWGIESLHHVRDMAYDEDRCRAQRGVIAQALACLRNFGIGLLRLFRYTNITAAIRAFAAQPDKILAMLNL